MNIDIIFMKIFLFKDPADGYYRLKHNVTTDMSHPIVVIGEVVHCNCHRHSDTCDRETGVCQVQTVEYQICYPGPSRAY